MNLPVGFGASRGQRGEKAFVIEVVAEDRGRSACGGLRRFIKVKWNRGIKCAKRGAWEGF
jgi:hypothetical protein